MTTPSQSSDRYQIKQQTTGTVTTITSNYHHERPPGILRLDINEAKLRRSSVEFKTPTETNLSPTSHTSTDGLSVTFAPERNSICRKMSATSDRLPAPGEEGEGSEDEDYSASVNAVIMRRASTRKSRHKSIRRRTSSPFSPDVESLYSTKRRRSSAYTTSSGETIISVNETAGSEEMYELLKLHKEVLSTVRTQTWPMRRKLRLVQLAQTYVKQHEGALHQRLAASRSTCDILKRYRLLMNKKWQYIKREISNFAKYITPWELRIKQIESQFGSVVASYFIFLRWLLSVNLVMATTLITFITIPEILTAKSDEAGDRKSILPDEEERKANLITLVNFEGILKHSPLFYGYYSNTSKFYRLPLAYFITGLLVYAYSFIATLRKMAANSRLSKLSEKEDECIFTWKLFTGWDYMIGNPETAQNRISSLVLGFKEALLEEAEKKRQDRNWKIIISRIFVNFLVLILLAISAFAVVWVVRRSERDDDENANWWRKNEINIVLNLISLIFPFLFEILGLLEYYHPRKQLRIQLFRIMLLNLLNLYSLIIALFDKIGDMTEQLQHRRINSRLANVSTPSIKLLKLISTTLPMTNYSTENTTRLNNVVTHMPKCNETCVSCTQLTGTVAKAVVTLLFTNCLTTNSSTNLSDGFNYTTTLSILNSTFNTTVPINEVQTMSFVVHDNFSSYNLTENTTTITYMSDTNDSVVLELPKNITESNSDYDLITNDVNCDSHFFNSNFSNDNMLQALNDIINDPSFIINITQYNQSIITTVNNDTTLSNIQESISNLFANNYTNGKGLLITALSSEECLITKCPTEDILSLNTKLNSIHGNNLRVETPMSFEEIKYLLDVRKKIRPLCWETSFGQELVKLTVTDLVFTIITTLIVDFFRALFVRYMNNCWCWDLEKKFPKYGDFKIAENILHLVNNQGMVWMGMFFSPGLVVINLFKLGIMMYLRSWTVLTCNVPHEIVFRASRSNNFYFGLLLTMLFLCVLPVGYAIVWVKPSWHCGPFSGYNTISEMFTKYLHHILPKKLHQALDYIASPGIIIPLLILLTLIIYYLMSLTNALREANHDLKAQLRKERTEERRKMFQIADKRYKNNSALEQTPYGRWKKLFSAMAVTKPSPQDVCLPIAQLDNIIVENPENQEKINKEIISKIVKNAFDMPQPKTETNSEVQETDKTLTKSTNVIEKVLHKNVNELQTNNKHSGSKNRHQSDSSAWSNSIPVIKISKTESIENILNNKHNKESKNLISKHNESCHTSSNDKILQNKSMENNQISSLSKLSEHISKKQEEEKKKLNEKLPETNTELTKTLSTIDNVEDKHSPSFKTDGKI